MAAEIIDGKKVANHIRKKLKAQVAKLAELGNKPGLAVVLVGDNSASKVYIRMKKKACQQVGIYSEEHILAADTNQQKLLALIEQLNKDEKIHGILVQLPLPDHLDESEVLNSISPTKDVDGFHPINVGKLSIGEKSFVPCTPAGVLELIHFYEIPIEGQHVVIIGRSNIVGKPIAQLFLAENATVTICHSRTRELEKECAKADILVVAVGKPELVKKNWIKPGAAVIDVGINRVNGKLIGDVDFENVLEVAGTITPVPGGVGPMTITMLLKNTVDAVNYQLKM